ncbi:hypothetical protein VFPPC_18256 [Pochonia chlamydosporia 170]|uniref:Uncharacterized protein n=1 Tax=Pochonia chlamydosporia 170 TaxID=1380566 RepID=A0A219AQF6_METCM|nr:hypothetical protein VFPPC_18256 [Pochonia chlamydosporia 170]OWT43023.1 hypothetical protein VFPPC_18256 [Pochonia chlamydosporia 170]
MGFKLGPSSTEGAAGLIGRCCRVILMSLILMNFLLGLCLTFRFFLGFY